MRHKIDALKAAEAEAAAKARYERAKADYERR